MRGCHLIQISFYTAGIARVFGKLIKISQMPAGTINHEAKNLLDKLEDINTLFTFSHRTEKSVYYRKNLNLMQIGDKQRQAGSSGQTLAGGLDCADFQFLFSVISDIFTHKVLHLVGLAILVITLVGFNKYYSMLSSDRGLFLFYESLKLGFNKRDYEQKECCLRPIYP